MKKKLLPYKVVRKDYDDEHYYWIDDKFVPATTTILDEAGPVAYGLRRFWQKNSMKEASQILDDAQEFGSLIHSSIETLLKGGKIDLKKDRSNYRKDFNKHIMSFYKWFHDFDPDLDSVQSELVIGSKKYEYGGTVDLVCQKDDETWLIDFKTSSGIYYKHKLQVSAYKAAYEEYKGKEIDKIGILRTGSRHKAGYEFKEVEYDFEGFENVYKTYLNLHGGQIPPPPKVEKYPDEIQLFEEIDT